MAALGKAVRSAVSSGRHEITKGMRKTPSIGPDIERWWKVTEVQIPGTKNALYRAFLDSLGQLPGINDEVLINVPGTVTITHRTGDTNIKSLTSNNIFTLTGGTLTVSETVQVNNRVVP